MKIYFIFALAAIAFFSINCANEEKWLKPRDYYKCEQQPFEEEDWKHLNVSICNKRWYAAQYGGTVYKDYKCCYVQFKIGDITQKGCYIVQDSKTGKQKYKQRGLSEVEEQTIICH